MVSSVTKKRETAAPVMTRAPAPRMAKRTMTLGPRLDIVGLRGDDEIGCRGGRSVVVLGLIWCGFVMGISEVGGGCGENSIVLSKGIAWKKRRRSEPCPVNRATKTRTCRLKNRSRQRRKCQESTTKRTLSMREETNSKRTQQTF